MFGKEDEKMFEEELEALMAIYCMPGECTIYGNSDSVCVVRVSTHRN